MSSEEKYVHPMDAAPHAWLVRPCSNYWEEHTHCRSLKHRFHQYYLYGEFADCSFWKERAKLCDRWEYFEDKAALTTLIEMEKQRHTDRLRPHLTNNVWERRAEPPKDWNKKLPASHEKRIEESYLKMLMDSSAESKGTSCVIL